MHLPCITTHHVAVSGDEGMHGARASEEENATWANQKVAKAPRAATRGHVPVTRTTTRPLHPMHAVRIAPVLAMAARRVRAAAPQVTFAMANFAEARLGITAEEEEYNQQ